VKRKPKRLANEKDELLKLCSKAKHIAEDAEDKLKEQLDYDIVTCYNNLFNKHWRNLFVALFLIGIVIFAPQLFNGAMYFFDWMPQVKFFDDLMPYIPFVSLVFSSAIFWDFFRFLFVPMGEKRKALARLEYSNQEENKDFQEQQRQKSERLHKTIIILIPCVITAAVTTIVIIHGMNVGASPLWNGIPIVSFAGASFVFRRDKSQNDRKESTEAPTEKNSSIKHEEKVSIGKGDDES